MRIQEVAPYDQLLYDEFSSAFERRIDALGPDFKRRVAAFEGALAAAETEGDGPQAASPSGTPYVDVQQLCGPSDAVYRTISRAERRSIHCPDKMPVGTTQVATNLCQKVYATRASACAWHLPAGLPAKMKPRRNAKKQNASVARPRRRARQRSG